MSATYLLRFILPSPPPFFRIRRIYARFSGSYTRAFAFFLGYGLPRRGAPRIASQTDYVVVTIIYM